MRLPAAWVFLSGVVAEGFPCRAHDVVDVRAASVLDAVAVFEVAVVAGAAAG